MECAIKSTDKNQKLKGKSRKSLDNWGQSSHKGRNIFINGLKLKMPLNQ
jgi:hypothetical protein